MKNFLVYLIALFAINQFAIAQPLNQKEIFTRSDTLRGMLSPLRSCYDINYYHLTIAVDIDKKFISGSNLFRFTATQDFKKLQFDLFENLKVEKILYKNQKLPFQREYNAVFVDFPETIKKESHEEFTVFYSGNPTIAKLAPWDGGFVFSKDKAGKPWVAVACQGLGASSWWPNKDHQSDEVDSMTISLNAPIGLMGVSNGRLKSIDRLRGIGVRYNWFVSYPINNYAVSINIADYAHFSDSYKGANGNLSLDYYVLKENLDDAKKQFKANVAPMLSCFENWFGPYPFYRDGYKLVETPYLGMEHQSGIAYGNKYQNGYMGMDLSGTGLGLKWDFIVVHESGHEWFGNNITSKDIADMWIHEAFAMYSEGLYVECTEGKEAGSKYIAGVRNKIQNDIPIIGTYNVNKEGSGDMYFKGANLLQMIRTLIDDDTKWRTILRGLNKDLGLKTTTTEEVVSYINQKAGKDFTKIFDQYLRYATIPTLEIKNNSKNSFSYRWKADVVGFDMPIRIKTSVTANWQFIYPTQNWQTITAETFQTDTLNFYVKEKMIK